MNDRQWYVRKHPGQWRYIASRVEYSNWAGTWYENAKDADGRTLRFWWKRNAQALADALNEQQVGEVMGKLLPCLCGRTPLVVNLAGWEIQCECGINMVHPSGERDPLISAWNTRAQPTTDLSQLPRYFLSGCRTESWDDCELYSELNEDGEWVKFADVKALLQGEKS